MPGRRDRTVRGPDTVVQCGAVIAGALTRVDGSVCTTGADDRPNTNANSTRGIGAHRSGATQTFSVDDRRVVAAWAADCAEHVLAIDETAVPGDTRVRAAMDQARLADVDRLSRSRGLRLGIRQPWDVDDSNEPVDLEVKRDEGITIRFDDGHLARIGMMELRQGMSVREVLLAAGT